MSEFTETQLERIADSLERISDDLHDINADGVSVHTVSTVGLEETVEKQTGYLVQSIDDMAKHVARAIAAGLASRSG